MEIDELILGDIIKRVNKMLSEVPVKSAKILNPFSPRFFFFLNFALLDSSDKILAESFGSR
jgi:hypothetical protein